MALTRWFRKRMRYLLAGLVVMLMISWGVLGTLQSLVQPAEESSGTIRGKSVSAAEVREALAALRMARVLGMMDPRTLGFLQSAGASPGVAMMMAALTGEFSDFVFEEQQRASWRFLVLLREAEEAGVDVTLAEAGELFSFLPVFWDREGFNRGRYNTFLLTHGVSDAAVSSYMRALTRTAKLIALRREAVQSSDAEVWMAYAHWNERAVVQFVEVDGSLFLPLVKASPEEVRAFYERHKGVVPDPASGTVGYMAPERAKVEYAVAPLEELAQQLDVSDEEIAAYYRENKTEFLVADDEAPPAEESSQGTVQGEPVENGTAEETPPAGLRYRQLDEVRDVIRQELLRQKARTKGQELVQSTVEALRSLEDDYANEPRPLGQMARRYGLLHRIARTADGRELLSREEVEQLVPGGWEVADFAFGQKWGLYYPTVFDSEDGRFVCQVLERREQEPKPLEQVEDQVRRDCLGQKALEHAATFGEKLRESAVRGSFETAVEEMNRRLVDLLGADEQPVLRSPATEGGPAPAEPGERAATQLLELRQSESFRRSDMGLPGIEEPLLAVVAKAFQVGPEEVAVTVEGPPVSRCYVVRTTERQEARQEEFAQEGVLYRIRYLMGKRSRTVREWMAGLLDAAQLTEQESG